MGHWTLCSYCGEHRLCSSYRVVGPPEHPLCEAGETFDVCSQKCLNETVRQNIQRYGPFQIDEFRA